MALPKISPAWVPPTPSAPDLGRALTPIEKKRFADVAKNKAKAAANRAGMDLLKAKILWEEMESQLLAAKDAYEIQTWHYGNKTNTDFPAGVLSTMNFNVALNRPKTVVRPDPDSDDTTYPSIRRGFWTHGGFPIDNSFGDKINQLEPAKHSGFLRSSDSFNKHYAYTPGTIISAMWHEDYGRDTYWRESDKPHLTLNRELGVIFSKRRKFIVLARFRDHYLVLPIMTSVAHRLAHEKTPHVDYMQVLNREHDIRKIQKLTEHEYLFQDREFVSSKNWENMPADGHALVWLTSPVAMSYNVKCEIMTRLEPESLKFLLCNWAAIVQRSALNHYFQEYVKAANYDSDARKVSDESIASLDRLLERTNVSSEIQPNEEPWNTVSPRKRRKLDLIAQQERRRVLAEEMDKVVRVLEAAEGMFPESEFVGVMRETVTDALGSIQVTCEYLRLLVKVLSTTISNRDTPQSLTGQFSQTDMGARAPLNRRNRRSPKSKPKESTPRYITTDSIVALTAEQHDQLGHQGLKEQDRKQGHGGCSATPPHQVSKEHGQKQTPRIYPATPLQKRRLPQQ